MSLKAYIRNEQDFLIYILAPEGTWQKYDPARHGAAETRQVGYVVAYLNGEVLEFRGPPHNLPPGTHYPARCDKSREVMPTCHDDSRIMVRHEASKYHRYGKYCTRIKNVGDAPFRIKRFAAFAKRLWGRFRLSTITNDWFSREQFVHWFNQKSEWIGPGDEVSDQDNYGFGNGYWVFEVEFQSGEIVMVKSALPRRGQL